MRRVTVPAEKLVQLFVTDPSKYAGIGDFVAVQVQDRQDNAVGHGIEKLVGMPARGERSSLRLAVADNAGDDQIRIVVGGAVGVRDRISELTALVNRPW